jgi:hypothetical protein
LAASAPAKEAAKTDAEAASMDHCEGGSAYYLYVRSQIRFLPVDHFSKSRFRHRTTASRDQTHGAHACATVALSLSKPKPPPADRRGLIGRMAQGDGEAVQPAGVAPRIRRVIELPQVSSGKSNYWPRDAILASGGRSGASPAQGAAGIGLRAWATHHSTRQSEGQSDPVPQQARPPKQHFRTPATGELLQGRSEQGAVDLAVYRIKANTLIEGNDDAIA